MNDSVIERVSPNLLFRHRIPIHATQESWSKQGTSLSQKHRLPGFGIFDGQSSYAKFHVAWSPKGLFFDVDVSGKQQSIWCRSTQILESDGVMVWIDTRNTQSIQRASRFCHWFVFLPSGTGAQRNQPGGTILKINRAKEDPKTFQSFKSYIACKQKTGGYRMQFFIDRSALTGWDPEEHRQIGFNYLITDREQGEQTLAAGTEFPISTNPSLWHTLKLV